jgi:putative protease
LLAPAGDADCLYAALQCGADAVYFGVREGFNARARAGNFALESLAETVALVHRCGARAYLALNTLVFEPELAGVEQVVRSAAAAGVDAVLVQDPAVALIAQRVAPDLAIHASTQMTISSPEAAAFAADLGATRAVLPRELSLHEIAAFVHGTELEAEVFVHGALCVAWSGQCLTSEAWGGRSANRGQCAQSCRLPYDLVLDGEVHDLGDVKYLLSPKDLAGVRAVPELVALGVHGLKIEGRQKGPQYVATAVSLYRRWLDAVVQGEADTPEARRRLQDDLLATSLSYTRGFGDGFLAGSDHQSLVEGRFPKHRGVYLGRVERVGRGEVVVAPDPAGRPWTGARALGDAHAGPRGDVSAALPALGGSTGAASGAPAAAIALRPGMGVVFDAGNPEEKDEPGGPLFRVEPRGARFVLGFGTPGPDLRRVHTGDRVWATSDPALARVVDRSHRERLPEMKSPLQFEVEGRIGAPLRIRAQSGGNAAVVETSTPAQAAAAGGLTAAILRAKLGALGDTCFELAGIDVQKLAPGLHVPVSELKAARRALVARLSTGRSASEDRLPHHGTQARTDVTARPPHRPPRACFAIEALSPPDAEPRLVPLCRSQEQLEAAIAAGVPEVELDWMELVGLGGAVERARAAGLQVILATLRVQKPGEEAFDARLSRLQPDGVLVRHWGGMVAFARRRAERPERFAGVRIHGDFALNVTNSVTAHHLFGWGLDTLTAAHDLDESQLFALLGGVPPERCAVVVHHRIPTFHTEHCVYSHLLSNGRDHRSCGRPCETHEVGLRDTLGRVHPVIVDAGCRNTVFNSEVQSAAGLVPRLLQRGVRRFRIEFVRESREEAAAVLAAYADLLAGRIRPEALLRSLHVTARQGMGAMQLLGALGHGGGGPDPAQVQR